jgi:hypothetical protein
MKIYDYIFFRHHKLDIFGYRLKIRLLWLVSMIRHRYLESFKEFKHEYHGQSSHHLELEWYYYDQWTDRDRYSNFL